MKTLYDLILASAEAALVLQDAAGAMPAGHNGPYRDPETPVRNTSHWLITFLKAYDLSGHPRFLAACEKALGYLLSDRARPMQATFWHRRNPEKDFCNGLIGQAWTIEALIAAYNTLEREDCRNLAETVFLLHPYDEDRGLWRRVSVDGSYLSFDLTLNHQLWFAATGALLFPTADVRVQQRLSHFLDRLPKHMLLYESGLIQHVMTLPEFAARTLPWYKRLVKAARGRPKPASKNGKAHTKAIGYHAFNLYALALLRQQLPGHRLWQHEKVRAALAYAGASGFRQALDQNEYGYPYNPPGFEMPLALQVFAEHFGGDVSDAASSWLSEQVRRCYDPETRFHERQTVDPRTHAARLYEATRLPDLPLI